MTEEVVLQNAKTELRSEIYTSIFTINIYRNFSKHVCNIKSASQRVQEIIHLLESLQLLSIPLLQLQNHPQYPSPES